MLYQVVMPIFIVFISVSSILLHKSLNHLALIGSAGLLLLTYYLSDRKVSMKIVQAVLLGIFHWFAQLNWCYSLYLAIAGKHYYNNQNFKKAIAVFILYITQYSFIRLLYSPQNLYSYLVTLIDYFVFIVIVYICDYIFRSEQLKKKLHNEKNHLISHDSLTGLYNYDEYHKQVERLLLYDDKLVIVLIDCTDLKSMNIRQGFHEGDRILRQTAELLKVKFADAYLIARYGGDEFSLVIKQDTGSIEKLSDIFNSEFQKLTGMQLSFGYALFPEDGQTKDELIIEAESKLFAMKRDIWIKREEHMFRSEKLRVVGELASGMAHEIRNPLTTIKGFIQLSRSNGYNIEPSYEVIMDEITRMSELTAEFLQFSKPHATNYKIQPIEQCIQRVIHLTKSEATRMGHQIVLKRCDQPLNILMDQDKMVQLLLNLVKNCFESMDDGGVVTFRMNHWENYAVIDIEDTGRGIQESELDKIFIPFYSTKDNGTGLGLPISHKIIQDHGGMMEVESVPLQGTKIRILLPLAKVETNTYQV